MQFTNRRFCEIEIRNIFNYKYYLFNYKLVGFVKLAPERETVDVLTSVSSRITGFVHSLRRFFKGGGLFLRATAGLESA